MPSLCFLLLIFRKCLKNIEQLFLEAIKKLDGMENMKGNHLIYDSHFQICKQPESNCLKRSEKLMALKKNQYAKFSVAFAFLDILVQWPLPTDSSNVEYNTISVSSRTHTLWKYCHESLSLSLSLSLFLSLSL